MSSPVYLLDTCVVLALVRGNALGAYLRTTFELADTVNRPLVSIVTHGELLVLADRNGWGGEKLSTLRAALDSLFTIDLNDASVLEAYVGVQRVSRAAAGGSRELAANDAWIVACAKAAGAVLLTTDRDFAHLTAPAGPVHYVDPKTNLREPTGS